MTPLGEAKLRDHEGRRLKAYDDATGQELVAGDTLRGNLSIGYGRNLSSRGISADEAISFLYTDIAIATAEARRAFDWFDFLDPVRQDFIIMMIFNLGLPKLKATNPKLLAAIERQDWQAAGAELMDGPWHVQVGATRANEMRAAIETGRWE